MSVEQKTRKIYNLIHNEQINDLRSINRMMSTLKNSIIKNGLHNIIKNKICADFGCGNTGNGGKVLLNLKASKVHFFDFDKSIKKPLLKKFIKEKSKIEINFGNIKKTGFKKKYFDFILCQGVIHHINKDELAFKEIHRILKKGGYLYFDVQGEGGLVTEFFNKILRKKYKENKFYKKTLNQILLKKKVYLNILKRDLNKSEIKILYKVASYFDDDFFLTLRDRILSPIYRCYNEEKLKKKLKKIGFRTIYRIKREPKFRNIRKLISPLYYDYKSDLSRLLFGEGNITLVVRK